MAAEVLKDLYKMQPAAKTAIEKAAGYAVFDNMGVNVLLLSTARGSGLAVNNKSKQETFMKMISAGGGLGMGVRDYDVVFVFETEKRNFLIPAGRVRGKRTLPRRLVIKAEHIPEQWKSLLEYGCTKSPRTV